MIDLLKAARVSLVPLLCSLAGPAAGTEQYLLRYVGYAYDARSGAPLYSEIHRLVVEEGEAVVSRVEYRDDVDRVVGDKDIDFRLDLFAPDVRLRDLRHGQEEGSRHRAGLIEVYHKPGPERPEKSRRLPVEGLVVVDAGLDRLIVENWDALQAGQPLRIRLLAPSRLDFVDYSVFKLREGDLDGVPTITFTAEPTNILLRALTTPIRITYSTVSRQMLVYEGSGSVRDAGGLRRAVRILFPASERQALPVGNETGGSAAGA